MKLITEYTESNISHFTEATKSGGKQHVIEGVFMQADK
jgi:hypothetical protein